MSLIVDVAPLDFGSFGIIPRYEDHILGVYLAELLAHLNSPNSTQKWGVYDWVLKNGEEHLRSPEDWQSQSLDFWHQLGYFPDRLIEEAEIRRDPTRYKALVEKMGLPYVEDPRGVLSSLSAEAVILASKVQSGGTVLITGYPGHGVGNYWARYGPDSEFRRKIKLDGDAVTIFFSYPVLPPKEKIEDELRRRGLNDLDHMTKLSALATAIGTFDKPKASDLRGMVGIAIESHRRYLRGEYETGLENALFRQIVSERSLYPLRRMIRDGTGNFAYLGNQVLELKDKNRL